jgi:hypothetical protein
VTERGRDFRTVLLALLDWGNRHFAPEGVSVQIVDAKTGIVADPIVVDRATGRPLVEPDYVLAPGPAVAEGMRLTGSLAYLFAALGLALVVYGLTLTAAVASGVWFRRSLRLASPMGAARQAGGVT